MGKLAQDIPHDAREESYNLDSSMCTSCTKMRALSSASSISVKVSVRRHRGLLSDTLNRFGRYVQIVGLVFEFSVNNTGCHFSGVSLLARA